MDSLYDVVLKLNETMCEVAWEELGKIPVDDDGNILERFGTWPVGTNREVIWKKFDELYPGGVIKLMCPEERSESTLR